MLTRAMILSASWFFLSLLMTLFRGSRIKGHHIGLSLGWLFAVLLAGDAWAILTFGVPIEMAGLSILAFLFTLFWIWRLPDWNALGQVTWSMTLLTTGLFIVYAFTVTSFSPLNPLSYLIAITFFFIEAFALLLALTHTFECLDVTCRVRWRRRIDQIAPIPGYAPMVSLHLPTYNEPVEVVRQTLHSLARLDYPNFEVLVVDNNTPDENNWRPLEEICKSLGPRFHCLHLHQWPGYKSGALNFALAQTNPSAEIIGTIDADYQLDPSFLRELVSGFADPRVAFVQTPQDYRDYQGNTYSEATYYGYKYFFEVSMPSRNERNAIIFCGTMGLIRRSVLEEIGGWDEWCITEDAEASLRILKRGYQSLYIKKTYGRGLMPFTFEGLKKQRFRWCFGGIQILKKHWETLMPWAHLTDPNNKLTLAQRYHYLTGGVQWFTDLFNLLFSCFLVLGAIFSLAPTSLQIRPLTGPIMAMPALFLVLNLWRFVWVLRLKLRLSFGRAVKTMYNFFSMGWVVTLATIQGIIQKQGVFLRTPKSKSGSRAWQALRVTQWEVMLGLICVGSGLIAFLAHPQLRTFFLGGLLFWQASLYLAAPVYSVLSARSDQAQALPPERGAAVLEHSAARWVLALATLVVIAVAAYQLLPGPFHTPAYTRYQPPEVPPGRLFGLNQVPLQERNLPLTSTPTPTPTQGLEPTHASTPTPTATPAATSGPLPTQTPTPVVTLPATPATGPTLTPTLSGGGISPTPTLVGVNSATPTPTVVGNNPLTPTPLPILSPTPSIIPTLGITP